MNRSVVIALAGLVTAASAIAAAGVVTYRAGGPYGERLGEDRRFVQRVKDPRTGELQLIISDRNHNGKMDCWDYFEHGRWVRTETDDDENGKIDHWYYYDDHENVSKIGFSTKNDGVADMWWHDGEQPGTNRIE